MKTLDEGLTRKQIIDAMIEKINELQDAVGVSFRWRIGPNYNEVVLDYETIELIVNKLKREEQA